MASTRMRYINKPCFQQTSQQQIRRMGVSMIIGLGKTHAQGIKRIENTATAVYLSTLSRL